MVNTINDSMICVGDVMLGTDPVKLGKNPWNSVNQDCCGVSFERVENLNF